MKSSTPCSVRRMDGVGVGTNLAFGALAELHLSYAFGLGGGLCPAGLAILFKWYASRPRI